MGALQTEIERRGERIFDLVDRHPEPLFSKAGFYQRMMALSMRDEHFKVQMFRFVDVLASLHRGTDIVRHLDEYFADMRNGYAPFIRTGVQLAKVVPFISGQVLRWNVSGMARQFIAGKNPNDVMKTLRKRRKQGIGFTVDLLGEAVVSEQEAAEYATRCLELLEHLARETHGWTDPLGKNTELFPVVNLSVKISALYSQMNPADPADAIAHLAPKLRPILRRARALGAFVNFDMESFAHKNATLELFRTLFTESEFRDWPNVGIVIQAYLRDAEDDLRDLLDWARARGTRFAVRLVKGAYWSFRISIALRHGWPGETRTGRNGLPRPGILPGGRTFARHVLSRSPSARKHFQRRFSARQIFGERFRRRIVARSGRSNLPKSERREACRSERQRYFARYTAR